jgi:hypothetical protein
MENTQGLAKLGKWTHTTHTHTYTHTSHSKEKHTSCLPPCTAGLVQPQHAPPSMRSAVRCGLRCPWPPHLHLLLAVGPPCQLRPRQRHAAGGGPAECVCECLCEFLCVCGGGCVYVCTCVCLYVLVCVLNYSGVSLP